MASLDIERESRYCEKVKLNGQDESLMTMKYFVVITEVPLAAHLSRYIIVLTSIQRDVNLHRGLEALEAPIHDYLHNPFL